MGKEFYEENISQSVSDDAPRNKVVYLHRREDDGIPFYIGIGSIGRAHDVHSRNDYWKNVYAKHGRIVEILHENLTWDEACEIEIRLIAKYRELHPDSMTNISAGGGGVSGLTGEKSHHYGKYGSLNSGSKGSVIGINENFYIILDGARDMENKNFNPGSISMSIKMNNGTTHNGYVWHRSKDCTREFVVALYKLQPFDSTSEDRLKDLIDAGIFAEESFVKARKLKHLRLTQLL